MGGPDPPVPMPGDRPARDNDTLPIAGRARPGAGKPAPSFGHGVTVGTFRIIRLLGEGGMGEVYLARDAALGRLVALKIIRSDRLRRPQAVERFLFEARATATFNHPNIISIYSAGEHAGVPWVALEYVPGKTLRQWLDVTQPGPRE